MDYKKKYEKYKAKYTTLKSQLGGKQKALDIIDWMEWIKDHNLVLKMSDLRKIKEGKKIEVVVAIIQHTYRKKFKTKIVKAKDYFDTEIFDYNDINSKDSIFYDCGDGYASTGTGCDIAILASNLRRTPNIIIDDDELITKK